MSNWRVKHIPEPTLAFRYGQTAEYPKDGLFLYGPVPSNQNPTRMDIGVIGTPDGVRRYSKWAGTIEKKIEVPPPRPGKKRNEANFFFWPGFSAAFSAEWPARPFATCQIDPTELTNRILGADRHAAIYQAVELYDLALRKYLREQDARPTLWFVIVPDDVFKYGRPKSFVPKLMRRIERTAIGRRAAASILAKGSMFQEEIDAAAVYEYELNFHNQLKARTLDTGQVLQVVRERTLAPDEYDETVRRSLQDPAAVAWNLATTSFYKAGGKPWRLAKIRDGVCYVGLVFKLLGKPSGRDNACCGAQMFLSSGDGVVFRGAVGPWFSETNGEFHLTHEQASSLMGMVVEAYREIHKTDPKELFIHGKTNFDDPEWAGFSSVVPSSTKLVGIKIRSQSDVKLFRYGKNTVLRGTSILVDDNKAYLWSRGYVPRLQTYAGREVPNPLLIEVKRGVANIETVLEDVMSLTKLNFNSANFSDGLPVTLRFADLVGEILTAGPTKVAVPLPFKFYI
jgi:hypothetical protein